MGGDEDKSGHIGYGKNHIEGRRHIPNHAERKQAATEYIYAKKAAVQPY